MPIAAQEAYVLWSLFDVMPDAEVNSLIEQIPCRVAKSRIRSSKPKLPYFHWRITLRISGCRAVSAIRLDAIVRRFYWRIYV